MNRSSMNRSCVNSNSGRRLELFVLLFASLLSILAADTAAPLPRPPVAKKVPKTTQVNGRRLVDNYFWLRDKKNPEVKAILRPRTPIQMR